MTGEPLTPPAAAAAARAAEPPGASDAAATGSATTGSGEAVARLFHRALAGIFLIAWLSLASQVQLLVGQRGLLPLADFVTAARAENALSLWTFPTLLAWMPRDGVLFGGTLLGVALSLIGLWGSWPRLCAALQTVWYLGYVTACRGFLGFQWDNLLLECGLLAAFLPADRRAPLAHLLFRGLLFKLYFESGLAKWQSPLHDWQDGSAMTFYYETAPLPTALAWYAHHLPRWWHLFESRATLALELLLPFAIFAPRRPRLAAAALFTVFQVVNAATANYGFFCPLAVTMHLFLLDDRHLRALSQRLRTLSPRVHALSRRLGHHLCPSASGRGAPSRPAIRTRRAAARIGAACWLLISLVVALFHFGDPGPVGRPLLPLLELSQTFRMVNAYHLFAAITRERIEPTFETQDDPGAPWQSHHLRYKAGAPTQAPRFVAPHQPRVDFLLWFYGLGFQRRQPVYVAELLARLCEEPTVVAPLFASPLPHAPVAVRITWWNYRFTSPAEKRVTGAWWNRRQLAASEPFACTTR